MVEFLLSAAIIAVTASLRFNVPSWSRSFTTATRFYSALTLYVLLQILIVYLLAATARVIALQFGLIDSPIWRHVLSPLSTAVIAILLLPSFPVLEAWPRRALQRIFGIPHKALHLSAEMVHANFQVREKLAEDVKSVLLRRGYDPDESWLPAAEPVHELWLKTAILFREIRDWESYPKYQSFIASARNEYDTLRRRYDQLSLKVPRTISNIERLGGVTLYLSQSASASSGYAPTPNTESANVGFKSDDGGVDETVRKCVSEMLGDLQEDISFLFRNICLFVARGVLTCERSSSRARRKLEAMGFVVAAKPSTQPVNVFLYAFFVFLTVLVVSFAVFGTSNANLGATKIAFRIVMIATIQTVALATAIIPKTLWGFANSTLSGHTPVSFVLGAGVVAAGLSLLINLMFGVLMFQSFGDAYERLLKSYPWAFMAFTTAATTAVLVQDHRWSLTRSPVSQRVKDGLVMATVMSISICIVRFLLFLLTNGLMPFGSVHQTVRDAGMMMAAFVIGICIGLVVPSSFREQRPLESGQPFGDRVPQIVSAHG